MDIQEFNSYLQSFNKKPEEFTEDEQLEIALKSKLLPVKYRNWNILASMIGYKAGGQALRQRVLRYQKKNQLTSDEQNVVFKNDYIEAQQIRDWYNAYRRDLRDESRVETFKQEIIKAAEKFSKLPALKYTKVLPKNINCKEAILCYSDLHIGVKCSNYYNEYNQDIAKKSLDDLAQSVIQYCHNNNVSRLSILNLGDLIHGLIHTNSRIEAELDVAEQIIVASELTAQFLCKLQEAAKEVNYYNVYDNHSRAIADKNNNIEKEQFSRVIDWFLQTRLKDTNINFCANEIDGGIGNITLINGKKAIFAHGHQDPKNSSFQNFIGLTRQWVDYIFLAHYHTPAQKDYQGCKVFVNGSIVGTESYAFGKRLFSEPSQKLVIFDTKNNDIIDINIAFEGRNFSK